MTWVVKSLTPRDRRMNEVSFEAFSLQLKFYKFKNVHPTSPLPLVQVHGTASD